MQESDDARRDYTAGNFHLLGKIAFATVKLCEVVMHVDKIGTAHKDILQKYFDGIYINDPVLVLQVCGMPISYTRNNINKFIRNMHVHTHANSSSRQKMSKSQKKRMKILADYMRDRASARVLFCIMSQWIATPFLRTIHEQHDSDFLLKERYTNRAGNTTEIGITESIVFNVMDEISHILKTGRMGWIQNKVIWPFVESYRSYFGDDLFEKIKDSSSYWYEWNPGSDCIM